MYVIYTKITIFRLSVTENKHWDILFKLDECNPLLGGSLAALADHRGSGASQEPGGAKNTPQGPGPMPLASDEKTRKVF